MSSTRLTAITGGIGAGKSVVANILRVMGYDVYDSDSEARRIMTESPVVRSELIETFGRKVFSGDGLRRDVLGAMVFGNAEMLAKLNAIVHRAVIDDIECWRADSGAARIFVETAILYTSGLVDSVDDVWFVTADDETRIARVIRRNGLSRESIVARMRAQDAEATASVGPRRYSIVNDGITPVIPRIHELLEAD